MLKATSAIDPEDARGATDRADRAGAGGFRIGRILVVCLGNICRSPMVEHVLRRRLAGRGVVVESAGLGAVTGAPIDPVACSVLAAHGIDAHGHVAQRLDQKMVDRADLVLVMERAHLDYLRRVFPSAAGKAFLLGKWQGNGEVLDPFGQPQEIFESLYEAVELAADRWCELI